jgi:hypothetical protein
MAHFALLDENNVVVTVLVGRDEDEGKEAELSARAGGVYKQTSYNTRGGIHYKEVIDENGNIDYVPSGKPQFRKNYAGVGYTYDEARDAFIPPKPLNSWILNEDTCDWEPPLPYPTDNKSYYWDEEQVKWVEIIPEEN